MATPINPLIARINQLHAGIAFSPRLAEANPGPTGSGGGDTGGGFDYGIGTGSGSGSDSGGGPSGSSGGGKTIPGTTKTSTSSSGCSGLWSLITSPIECGLLRLVILILGLLAIIAAIYFYKPTSFIVQAPVKAAAGAVKDLGSGAGVAAVA